MKKCFTNIYFCLIEGKPGKADVGEALLDAVTAPSQFGHSNGRKIYSVNVFV